LRFAGWGGALRERLGSVGARGETNTHLPPIPYFLFSFPWPFPDHFWLVGTWAANNQIKKFNKVNLNIKYFDKFLVVGFWFACVVATPGVEVWILTSPTMMLTAQLKGSKADFTQGDQADTALSKLLTDLKNKFALLAFAFSYLGVKKKI